MPSVRLRCQQVLLNNLQCTQPTFRDGKLCRWHRISNEFHADYRNKGRLLSQGLSFGALLSVVLAATALWNFFQEAEILWLLMGVWGLGWAFCLFADSLIALDYPLSQLTIWSKMLAIGIVLVVAGGVGIFCCASSLPDSSLPVLRRVLGGRLDHLYGLPSIGAAVLVVAASFFLMFVRRILYLEAPRLGSLFVWPLVLLLIAGTFRPALQDHGVAPTPEQLEGFWGSVVGNDVSVALGVSWCVAFMVCEFVNVAIRRQRCDPKLFKRTVWPSYPVCTGAPVVGLLVSRLLLGILGVRSAVAFGLIAIVLSVPLCVLFTGWVVRHAVRAFEMEYYSSNQAFERYEEDQA